MTRRLLCLHGHFYQPPRREPWIEEIEVQDSAEPFHDWNERIAEECYAPNGAARNQERRRPDRRHRRQLPAPLLQLRADPARLAGEAPPRRLRAGPRVGRAQPGAARPRERHRPGLQPRHPAALLAARPAHPDPLGGGRLPAEVRPCAGGDVAPGDRRRLGDPWAHWPRRGCASPCSRPIRSAGSALPGGLDRRVGGALRPDPAVPGPLRRARDGGLLLRRAHRPVDRLRERARLARRTARGPAGGLRRSPRARRGAHGRFDGETLGHHKKGGDEVLAAALRRLASGGEVEVVNFAQALERVPVDWEAEIFEGSSWSCAHGIERWRSDCGCEVGGRPGWRQAWRAPLRAALDDLRDRLHGLFEREAAPLLADPWGARDRFARCSATRSGARLASSSIGRRAAPSGRTSGERRCGCSRWSARRCSCTRAAAGSSPRSPGSRPCRC